MGSAAELLVGLTVIVEAPVSVGVALGTGLLFAVSTGAGASRAAMLNPTMPPPRVPSHSAMAAADKTVASRLMATPFATTTLIQSRLLT